MMKIELNKKELQLLSLLFDSIKERNKTELMGNIIIRKLYGGNVDFLLYPIRVSRCKKCTNNKV